MIMTTEFINAEAEYRAQRLAEDYPHARRSRTIRSYLHLPRRNRRDRVRVGSLARG